MDQQIGRSWTTIQSSKLPHLRIINCAR